MYLHACMHACARVRVCVCVCVCVWVWVWVCARACVCVHKLMQYTKMHLHRQVCLHAFPERPKYHQYHNSQIYHHVLLSRSTGIVTKQRKYVEKFNSPVLYSTWNQILQAAKLFAGFERWFHSKSSDRLSRSPSASIDRIRGTKPLSGWHDDRSM